MSLQMKQPQIDKQNSKISQNESLKGNINLKKFPPNSLTQAINTIIYGKQSIKKYTQKRKNFHNTILYLHEDDFTIIQWISEKKLYSESRIDLKMVTNISDNPTQNALKKLKKENILVLTVGETKFLALEFPNSQIKNLWWQGIQHFWINSKNENIINHIQNLSHTLFLKFDKDGTKYLDRKEIKALMNEMHISITEEWFDKTFYQFDKNKNDQIDYDEFKQMMIKISLKDEVSPIFQNFCKRAKEGLEDIEANVMTAQELQNFYLKEQNQRMDLQDEIIPLIDFYKKNNNNQEQKQTTLSFLNFCNILFCMKNEIFNKEKTKPFQDMNQPLTNYWINSSHNTYLVSNQLTGESSTQAYVNAFQKGCRCVELDCWDGDKGEPIVYHGHTLTSKIMFEDIIQVINDYAFLKNPYPVILSIENHCSKKQQDRMAEIIKKVLGSSLYTLPKDWENLKNYPSPNDLKKKVLIKDKAKLLKTTENFNEELNENVSVEEIGETHNMETRTLSMIPKVNYLKKPSVETLKFESDKKLMNFDKEREESKFKKNYGYEVKNLDKIENKIKQEFFKKLELNSGKGNALGVIHEKNNDSDRKLSEKTSVKKNKKEKELSLDLIRLITMFGCKFLLGDPERLTWNISSLSEDKVLKQLQSNEIAFIDHNKWTFTRTYPGGLRIDSSNYDPMPAFVTGCQVIALNFQTNDLNLQIYLSKFQINGGVNCGYVLKPDFMLFNSKKPRYPKDFTSSVCKITLKIISGTQLKPKKKKESDILDPFIEVHLKGLPIEEKMNKVCRTPVVKNNGFNPQFGDVFTFNIYCPEIAVLVFQVWDQDNVSNEKIGSYAVPIDCIRTGYRVVPLRNTIDFNFIDNCFIFCHIEKQFL